MIRDVEFQDLAFAVKERTGFFTEGIHRPILKQISGIFKHGQLSAIMGPSGAGKSSLLNALCGISTSGVSGTIKINRKSSCYITQEDMHRSLLTVKELMKIACSLKIKSSSNTNKTALINEILTSLHLNHRQKCTADQLSGGEKKRLSIALEMVANPSIFFLDEPTSGLDDVTASQCVKLLKEMATQGRTVVCTIHQPSAAIFSMFDQIFVLAKGVCVYQGAPLALVPLLSHVNLKCPSHYNPADYIIEVCEEHDVIPTLAKFFQNGKLVCEYTPETPPEFEMKIPITSMILDTTRLQGGETFLQKMKTFTRFMQSDYALSALHQFFVLFRMMMTVIFRSRMVFWIQLFHHLVCGGGIGLIFYNTANEGERMFDHLKYCMGVVFTVVYTQVMVPILSYPQEVKIVKKECFNRWYGLFPYYTALTLSRVPVQTLLNIIFLSIVYWMSGLPHELWRFGLFAMIGIITSFVAEGLGLAIGATFSITNGCAVGPMFIAPFLGLAIYGFDCAQSIPFLMNVLMKFSFVRGSVISMVFTVFGFNRKRLECNVAYCHFAEPRTLLKYLDIENLSLVKEMGILIALMVFFRVLCYLSLRKRFRT